MKHLGIEGLSALLASVAFAPTASAQAMSPGIYYAEQIPTRASGVRGVRAQEAFSLVRSAYRGQYKAQGIPAFRSLENAYRRGQIDAEDLVRSAVQAEDLSPQALEDAAYLNAVEANLRTLVGTN